MAFQFPWTNFHELNLDWFLSKFKQFTNNFLETTATAESVPYDAQPSVTVTGGELDDDTDIVNPFNFHFKIPTGMGILSLTITYNVTDDDTQPSTGWSNTKPAVNPGQYLWIRQTIILQNGVGQSYTYFVYYPVDGTTPTIDIDDYPTEDSHNAVSSGGVFTALNDWAELMGQWTANKIAWTENGNTASRAYNVGDFVVITGNMAIITASVANGATLTENVNYKVIEISGGGFNNIVQDISNQVAFTADWSAQLDTSEIHAIKIGRLVVADIWFKSVANAVTPSSPVMISGFPKYSTTGSLNYQYLYLLQAQGSSNIATSVAAVLYINNSGSILNYTGFNTALTNRALLLKVMYICD